MATTTAAVVTCMLAGVTHAQPSGSKTNIVLIMADDQGWGDVGYNPYQYQNDAYDYKWTFNAPR